MKTSQWIVGGDGWAYDIGFSGIDHVLASGEDVNILLWITKCMPIQADKHLKATPASAIAKFSAGGKHTSKKI